MIPAAKGISGGISVREKPTRTFRINTDSKIIAGYSDGIEAMKQAVYIMLSVERYEHIIHSWGYGAELKSLIGKPISYCLPEIKRRITEALMRDRRITDVNSFEFETRKGQVHAAFTAETVFGPVRAERTVEI